MLAFRERLIRTLRAIQPVLDVPGVVIVGSEVPNLIEPGAASTLVVSEDVDIAVPLGVHADVDDALGALLRHAHLGLGGVGSGDRARQ